MRNNPEDCRSQDLRFFYLALYVTARIAEYISYYIIHERIIGKDLEGNICVLN
jgi:hypothetical protein